MRNGVAVGASNAFKKHFTFDLYFMRQNDGRMLGRNQHYRDGHEVSTVNAKTPKPQKPHMTSRAWRWFVVAPKMADSGDACMPFRNHANVTYIF